MISNNTKSLYQKVSNRRNNHQGSHLAFVWRYYSFLKCPKAHFASYRSSPLYLRNQLKNFRKISAVQRIWARKSNDPDQNDVQLQWHMRELSQEKSGLMAHLQCGHRHVDGTISSVSTNVVNIFRLYHKTLSQVCSNI